MSVKPSPGLLWLSLILGISHDLSDLSFTVCKTVTLPPLPPLPPSQRCFLAILHKTEKVSVLPLILGPCWVPKPVGSQRTKRGTCGPTSIHPWWASGQAGGSTRPREVVHMCLHVSARVYHVCAYLHVHARMCMCVTCECCVCVSCVPCGRVCTKQRRNRAEPRLARPWGGQLVHFLNPGGRGGSLGVPWCRSQSWGFWAVGRQIGAWSWSREELTINVRRPGPASPTGPGAGRKCGRKQGVVAAAVQSAGPWVAAACPGWLRRPAGPAGREPGATTWCLPTTARELPLRSWTQVRGTPGRAGRGPAEWVSSTELGLATHGAI